ncbi:MAG: hypothetical protein ACJ76F_10430 [Bacteroidia bacterium]
MKKIKLFSGFIVALAVMGIIFISNSCAKPKPCKAIITIYDTTGTVPQANVHIKLFANVNGSVADLKAEGDTDSDGKLSLTFKLPAILDIDALKANCTVVAPTTTAGVYVPGKYCHGKGIIKLEEGKTIEKSVNLKD